MTRKQRLQTHDELDDELDAYFCALQIADLPKKLPMPGRSPRKASTPQSRRAKPDQEPSIAAWPPPRGRSCSILSLPDELLIAIFATARRTLSILKPGLDIYESVFVPRAGVLCRLALVNRRFNRIASEMIFADTVVAPPRRGSSDFVGSSRNLLGWVAALKRDKARADTVRAVTLLNIPKWAPWSQFASTVSTLPHLVTLNIAESSIVCPAELFGALPESLKVLEVSKIPRTGRPCRPDCPSAHPKPRLRSLETVKLSFDSGETMGMCFKDRLNDYTTDLGSLFCCGGLKHLELEDLPHSPIVDSVIVQSLDANSETLVRVKLTFAPSRPYRGLFKPRLNLSHFATLDQLHTLVFHHGAVGADRESLANLPRSLHTLVLTHHAGFLDRAAVSAFQKERGSTLRLLRIACDQEHGKRVVVRVRRESEVE